MSLQLDIFVPDRRSTSVPMHSCFYLQASVHKLKGKNTLSAGGIGGSATNGEATNSSACSSLYLHIGVLDAKYGRVTQALGRNDADAKLSLAAGHLPQGCRLSQKQSSLVVSCAADARRSVIKLRFSTIPLHER